MTATGVGIGFKCICKNAQLPSACLPATEMHYQQRSYLHPAKTTARSLAMWWSVYILRMFILVQPLRFQATFRVYFKGFHCIVFWSKCGEEEYEKVVVMIFLLLLFFSDALNRLKRTAEGTASSRILLENKGEVMLFPLPLTHMQPVGIQVLIHFWICQWNAPLPNEFAARFHYHRNGPTSTIYWFTAGNNSWF